MILFILCVSLLTWPSSKCEPSVNSYLPPSNNGIGRPSTQYGPPERDGGNNFGDNRPSQPGFGHSPENNYLPPEQSSVSKPDTQYGSPKSDNFGQNTFQNRGGVRPNSQYGSSNQGDGQSSKLAYNEYSLSTGNGGSDFKNVGKSSSRGSGQTLSYNTPTSSEHNQIHTNGFTPNHESARPEGPSSRLKEGRPTSPSSSYGVPNVDRINGGPRPNFGGEDTGEPAKYEFNYEVDDSQTGTKFGHSEHRDGDLATGEYNVVLPDGRKQVVEYEADLDGFKPQIRYEGTPQVESQGSNRGHHGSSNGDGFPETNHGQPGIFGQYHNANTYANDENEPTQGEAEYPSSRPGNLRNEQRNKQRNGYSNGDSGHSAPEHGYPGSNDGSQGFNGNNEGSPRCTNGNNGGQQGRGCSGAGGEGRPQNGYNNSPRDKEDYDGPEGFNRNNQGYPRCPNVNNGGQQGQGCLGSGGDGRSQNGYNNSSHDNEGYPSGRPKGPIGTGY